MFRELFLEFSAAKSTVYSDKNEFEKELQKVYKGINNIKSITSKRDTVTFDTNKGKRIIKLDTEDDAEELVSRLNKKLEMINNNLE